MRVEGFRADSSVRRLLGWDVHTTRVAGTSLKRLQNNYYERRVGDRRTKNGM